jgi:iron complex transport system ATP-binding protein
MSELVVRLENICFRREGRLILRDVSWQIDKGQNWALLGANGSGKTTLLKIITGYEWPTSGKVSVLGNEYGKCLIQDVRKNVGWVSSNISTKIPTNDKAIEIVVSGIEASMGLYREYNNEEYDRAKAAMKMLSAESFAEQRYSLLSQGEQQRVLIARALINEPKLLVLDEPCAGLDPGAKEVFLGDLAKLAEHRDAPGIILVTHHVDEIRQWINNVMIIKNGSKLATGKTTDVLNDNNLSEAFGCACRVTNNTGRYWMVAG